MKELERSSSAERNCVVLGVGRLCVRSLDRCAGNSNKLKSLAYEKLLLHLARGCLAVGNIEECVNTCEHVRARLTSVTPVRPEQAAILGHTFKLLWCAADKEGGGGASGGELMLGVYGKALQCAVASGEMDITEVVECCMKAEHCFKRSVASLSTTCTASSSSGSHLQCLNTFHHSVLPLSSVVSSATPHLPCQKFLTVALYLLHRATHAIKLGTWKDGCGLNKALALLNEHQTGCDLMHHLILLPHVGLLQVWLSLLHTPARRLVHVFP